MDEYKFDPDEYEKALFGGKLPLYEPPQIPQTQQPDNRNTTTLQDFGTDLKRGLEEVPGAVTGALDILPALVANARPFSKAADYLGEVTGFQPGKWADEAVNEYSPERVKARQAIQAAWDDPNKTKWDVMAEYIRHPSASIGTVIESAPSMIGAAGVARKIISKAVPRLAEGASKEAVAARADEVRKIAPLATGVGEGAVTAGQTMDNYTGEDNRKAALSALGAGTITGAIGVGAGKLANKYGLGDIDIALSGGGVGTVGKGALRRIGGGIATESGEEFLQSGQEQAWQNYANNAPLTNGVMQAAVEGAIAGGIMGGGINLIPGKKDLLRRDITPQKITPSEIVAFPDKSLMPTKQLAIPGEEFRRIAELAHQQGEESNTDSTFVDKNLYGVLRKRGVPHEDALAIASPYSASKDTGGQLGLFSIPPTEIVATPVKPVKKLSPRAELRNAVDSYKARGLISDEAHTDIINDLDTGAKTPEVKKRVLLALKDTYDNLKKVAKQRAKNERIKKAGEISGVKTNFGKFAETERRLAVEKELRKRIQEDLAADKEAELKWINDVVEGARAQKIARHRIHLLTGILSDPNVENKSGKFLRVLKKKYPMYEQSLTDSEKNLIARYEDLMAAFGQPGLQMNLFGGADTPIDYTSTETEQQPETNQETQESGQLKLFDKNGKPTRSAMARKLGKKLEARSGKSEEAKGKKATGGEPAKAKNLVPAEKKPETTIPAKKTVELTQEEEDKLDAFLRGKYSKLAEKARKDAEKLGAKPIDIGEEGGFDVYTSGVEIIPLDEWERQVSAEEAEFNTDDDYGDTYELEDSYGNIHELRFSTAKNASKPMGVDIDAAKKKVNDIVSNWSNPPVVKVLNFSDLPKNMQQWLIERDERYARGFLTDTGSVYILADNNDSLPEITATLFHEALGHYGLRKEFGVGLEKLMLDIYKSNAEIRTLADKYAKEHKVDTATAVEEILAESQTMGGIKASILQKIASFIRSFLRKIGLNLKMSESEIVAVLDKARVRVVSGDPTQTFVGKQPVTRSASRMTAAINYIYRRSFKEQIRYGWDKSLNTVMFTNDLVERATKAGLKSAKKFGDLMEEKMAVRDSYEQKIASIMSKFYELPDDERAAANKFVKESTLSLKWGYDEVETYSYEYPTNKLVVKTEKVNADPEMAKKFNSLSKDAQKLVKDLFNFNRLLYATLKHEVEREIGKEYDSMLKYAQNSEELGNIKKAREQALAAAGNKFPVLEGPYAALRRFGDHVVVARSKQMVEAINNNDVETIKKLETNPNHYSVEFFSSRFEAVEREDELKKLKEFSEGEVYSGLRDDVEALSRQIPWEAVSIIKQRIEAMPDDVDVKFNMQKVLTSIYLNSLSETSARKAELERKGIAGADDDMFRAFSSHGAASAHYIASLRHSSAISDSINKMAKEVRDDRSNVLRADIKNELTRRYAQSLAYTENPLVNKAMKMTSFWMLITSPAYYFQNAVQPFMLSLPYMAGKYGFNKSLSALTQAYSDVFSYVVSSKSHQLDIEMMNLTDGEKKMLKDLQAHGRLDLTLVQDMNRFINGEGILDKGAVGRLSRWLWAKPQVIELLNRVSTAVAAYRLSIGNNEISESEHVAAWESAKDYADDVVVHTHGNYSSFNAPRFFTKNGAMRLITQFRKYQLIQLTLLARILHKSLSFAASAEERSVAWRMGLYLLGTHMTMTGMVGVPLALTIMGMFGGNDGEPDEEVVRKWMKEAGFNQQMIDLLMRGAPTLLGLDIATKVGMSNVFSLIPFADMPKDRSTFDKAVVSSLGATVGLVRNMLDGADMMSKGDYVKGFEKFMPKGLEDAIKAYRLATDGLTNRQNDVLIKPEDFDYIDTILQGIGIQSTKISAQMRRRDAQAEIEKFFDEKTSQLYHDFDKAFKNKDLDFRKQIIHEWRELQIQRKQAGLRPMPVSALIKHALAQRRRELRTFNGVQYTPGDRNLVRQLQ